MSDPRKSVHRIANPHVADMVLNAASHHVADAVQKIANDTGISGASAVLMGITVWWRELRELDPAATAKLFRAYADIANPAKTPQEKEKAEKRRRAAVETLFSQLNLGMANPEGQG